MDHGQHFGDSDGPADERDHVPAPLVHPADPELRHDRVRAAKEVLHVQLHEADARQGARVASPTKRGFVGSRSMARKKPTSESVA